MSAKMHLVSAENVTTGPELVRLVVPADARYLSAVRLVAAAVASDLSFTVDDIDELRMGVDEAVAALVVHAEPDDRIDLSFTLTRAAPALLCVEGSIVGADADDDRAVAGSGDGPVDAADTVDPLARRIVAAVTDRCTLGPTSFALEKSSSITATVR